MNEFRPNAYDIGTVPDAPGSPAWRNYAPADAPPSLLGMYYANGLTREQMPDGKAVSTVDGITWEAEDAWRNARRETVRIAQRMVATLNAMSPQVLTDHAFRRAQPYRRLRAYFGRVEQLAREGRIG